MLGLSQKSIYLIGIVLSLTITSGLSLGFVAGRSLIQKSDTVTNAPLVSNPPADEKESFLNKLLKPLQSNPQPTSASQPFSNESGSNPQSGSTSQPTSNSNQGQNSPGNTTTSSPTLYPTQTPAQQYVNPTIMPTTPLQQPTTAPTLLPTQAQSNTATIQADAVWHPGNSDQYVYNGIVRVKDALSGEVLAYGLTSSGGRIRFDNVPAERNVDVILLKPSEWQSDLCGDKQTFFLRKGEFKGLLLRLRSSGSSPCEK